MTSLHRGAAAWLLVAALAAACSQAPAATTSRAAPGDSRSDHAKSAVGHSGGSGQNAATTKAPRTPLAKPFRHRLPGMPPPIDNNVYGADRAGMVSPRIAHEPAYLYVPDSNGSTVTVISQRTHKIVKVLQAGELSQHVTPAYNLSRLYVDSSVANRVYTIDPHNATISGSHRVPRPYNLYFTPNGKQAIVMVEEYNEIKFVNPHTFKGPKGLVVPGCLGPNHADFSANGRFFVVTCEFSGELLKISTLSHRVLGTIHFGMSAMPQDVRIAPDGRVFYVAVMGKNKVSIVNAKHFRIVGSIPTPSMPHGLYPSRNSKLLYVTDRGAGKVTVVSFATNKVVDTWNIGPGASPDMGGVSADGSMLWVSGRYDGVVYGINTHTGKTVARIHVGGSPHGLCVWPQPGRYSLGHTGNMR